MNSYDRAQLFELGYAFRRRFAFVRIDSLLSHEVTGDIGEEPDVEIPGHPDYQQVREDVIEESALSNLAIKEIIFDTEELTNDSPNRLSPFGTDCAPINPEFAKRESLETKLSELKDQLDIHPDNGDFVDVILEFCLAADHLDLVDIGQALAIDAVKFVLSYSMLFEDEELDSKVVDNAVISYLLPQLDNIMPELRQAETVNPESNVPEKFEQLVQFAYSLNLERTAERLKDMQETRSFV